MKDNTLVSFFFPIFLGCIFLEVIYVNFWTQRNLYSTKDSVSNLLVSVGQYLCEAASGLLLLPLYVGVQQHKLFELPSGVGTFVALAVLLDFVYYWVHRFSHEVRWMWATHVVHHSSGYLNLTTSFRLGWTGLLSGVWLFWIPLVWIGFTPMQIINAIAVNLIYQFFTHSVTKSRFGPLEWVLNTPSHHRVHHAVAPQYLDKNYGGIFIIWDRLFGTFAAEEAGTPTRYGTVQPLESHNPFRIAFAEWLAIWRDLAGPALLRDKLRFVFGPPGWSRDGSRKTSRQIRDEWLLRRRGDAAGTDLIYLPIEQQRIDIP